MTRKHVVIVFSLLIGMAAGVGGTLWSLFQAPAFYETALLNDIPPAKRKEEAKRFIQTTLQLVDEIKHEQNWSEEFSQDQVNSWLAEELHPKYSGWLPKAVKEPRVQFGAESLQLAFQFHRGYWSGVISADLKVWVSRPNELAIEIRSIKAGLIPIPLDNVVLQVSKELRNIGWRIEHSRNDGNDLLVVKLGDEDEEQSILELVQMTPHRVRIAGSRKSPRSLAALRLRDRPYGARPARAVLK